MEAIRSVNFLRSKPMVTDPSGPHPIKKASPKSRRQGAAGTSKRERQGMISLSRSSRTITQVHLSYTNHRNLFHTTRNIVNSPAALRYNRAGLSLVATAWLSGRIVRHPPQV